MGNFCVKPITKDEVMSPVPAEQLSPIVPIAENVSESEASSHSDQPPKPFGRWMIEADDKPPSFTIDMSNPVDNELVTVLVQMYVKHNAPVSFDSRTDYSAECEGSYLDERDVEDDDDVYNKTPGVPLIM